MEIFAQWLVRKVPFRKHKGNLSLSLYRAIFYLSAFIFYYAGSFGESGALFCYIAILFPFLSKFCIGFHIWVNRNKLQKWIFPQMRVYGCYTANSHLSHQPNIFVFGCVFCHFWPFSRQRKQSFVRYFELRHFLSQLDHLFSWVSWFLSQIGSFSALFSMKIWVRVKKIDLGSEWTKKTLTYFRSEYHLL